jgi:hypothetical protein
VTSIAWWPLFFPHPTDKQQLQVVATFKRHSLYISFVVLYLHMSPKGTTATLCASPGKARAISVAPQSEAKSIRSQFRMRRRQ